MAIRMRMAPADGSSVMRAEGAVSAESRAALERVEGGRPPVIDFPRARVAMALLAPSEREAPCPHEGTAVTFDMAAAHGRVAAAAGSYAPPRPAVAALAGHVAFDADLVTVERI